MTERVLRGIEALYFDYNHPRTLQWLKQQVYVSPFSKFIPRGIYVNATDIIVVSVINTPARYYVYHDRWREEGVYIYSGEGKNGDQKETVGNRALINAIHEKRPVRLLAFDYEGMCRNKKSIYYDQGLFQVEDRDYVLDYGADRELRKEFKFVLRKTGD